MALKASLVLTGDASAATAALGQVDAALDQTTASAKRAAAANDDLGRKIATSAGQARAGYSQLGQQAQDVAIQLQMGTNIGTIVAQQGGQVASAVAMMGGRFAGLASFLAGPWGAAVLVGGGALLNTLIPALFGAGDAAEASGKKQMSLADALGESKFATEEAQKALADYYAEQQRSLTQTDSYTKVLLGQAAAKMKDALATREQLAAELAKREATAKDVASLGEDPTGAKMLADITRGKLADNDARIGTLNNALRGLLIKDAARDAAAAADPLKAINNRYDDMAEAAKRAAIGNGALTRSLKDTLTQIELNRKAEIERTQAARRTSRRTATAPSGLFGREIDLAQAKAIAADAHYVVNSGYRSTAKQKTLYDEWVAAGRPSDNPVARPGTSAHERSNALDIAFGKGVTPAALKKTYADQGVQLTKIIRERGHFHIEWSTKGADKVQHEAEQLANFGDQAAKRLAGIADQFTDVAPAVVKANAATRDLDQTIADLAARQPPGFEKMIADAEALKDVVAASLTKPLDDYLASARESATVDQLLLAGKRDQAGALQVALGLQRQMGPLTEEQLATIQETVIAERQRGEQLQLQQEMIGNYLDATRSVRSEVEAILSGTGKLSNLQQIFRNLQGKVLAEKLFGATFRDLDKWVQDDSGMKDATTFMAEQTRNAGKEALDLAAAFRTAGGQIRAAASGQAGSSAFDAAFADLGAGAVDPAVGNEIVVTAKLEKPKQGSLLDVSIDDYMRRLSGGLAKDITTAFNEALGTQFFGKFTGSLAGAMQGYMVSGSPWGAALGALKEIPNLPKGISEALNGKMVDGKMVGGAFNGLATGSQTAGLAGAFGIKMSNGGAQIGGAIGGALPIPGGAIIGSIAGGLLGGLFKSKPYGTSLVTSGDGKLTGSGKEASVATGLGGSVQEGLNRIADQLGAQLGSFKVSIGTYNGTYRVNTNGYAGDKLNTKGASGVGLRQFQTEGEAVGFAISDAIADGALSGLSSAVQKALQSNSGDIDKALAEALKVQDLEELLGGVTGQMGKALADFERQAKERLRVATAYGFDVLKVEELNAKQRLKLSEKLLDEQVGSLQRLIDEMTGGSLFEGTAIDRRAALLDQIAAAKSAADSGTEGAADKLAGLLEQLNAVSKDVFGTTGGFAADRSTILDQARDVIAKANQRIADAQAKSDPALATTNAALDENNDQNARIIAGVEGANARLDAIIGLPNAAASQRLIELARTGAIR